MRSRKRSGTVAEILRAARVRLLRSGLGNTRVEDIIEEAQVARSTFYRHFGGMDDIAVRLAMDETLEAMHEAAEEAERSGAEIPIQLARILATVARRPLPITRLIELESASLRLVNLVIMRPELMQRMAAPFTPLIEQGQRGGIIRSDCPAIELAEWLARNMATLMLLPPAGVDCEKTSETYALRFVLPGVLAVATQPSGAVEKRFDELAAAIQRIETILHAASPTP